MERFNKPRVFLSHSSLDKKFIRRINNDLLACKIAPWLDEGEIRDGKSFLKSIFEDGLPICDSVIVYLTEHSIKSKFVQKEIDVALVKELNDNNIRILPYVSDSKLRRNLRSDIQTLHIREWNNKNYNEIFPQIVAEIWLSYLEKVSKDLLLPIQNEKLKLELELEKLKVDSSGPFSKAENKEFDYLHTLFNKSVQCEIYIDKESQSIAHVPKEKWRCELNIVDLLVFALKDSFSKRSGLNVRSNTDSGLTHFIYRRFLELKQKYLEENNLSIWSVKLLTFPYLELKASKLINIDGEILFFLDKMFRFYHWLNYHKKFKEVLTLYKLSKKVLRD